MSFDFAGRGAPERWRAIFKLLFLTVLCFATPQLAAADKGGSGGGHSDGSNSGRDGPDDVSHSESGHVGKGKEGRGDDTSSRDTGKKHEYKGGWLDRIRNGNYEVFDPAGRLVIRRKARSDDYGKF